MRGEEGGRGGAYSMKIKDGVANFEDIFIGCYSGHKLETIVQNKLGNMRKYVTGEQRRKRKRQT